MYKAQIPGLDIWKGWIYRDSLEACCSHNCSSFSVLALTPITFSFYPTRHLDSHAQSTVTITNRISTHEPSYTKRQAGSRTTQISDYSPPASRPLMPSSCKTLLTSIPVMRTSSPDTQDSKHSRELNKAKTLLKLGHARTATRGICSPSPALTEPSE